MCSPSRCTWVTISPLTRCAPGRSFGTAGMRALLATPVLAIHSLGNSMVRPAQKLSAQLPTNTLPSRCCCHRHSRINQGITPNHMNHELTYLKSAFNELIRIGEWKSSNPYSRLKKLKFAERELSFLSFAEIHRLLSELESSRNRDVVTVSKICLSIGCRWGEAEKLRAEHVHAGKIHITATKNGRNRSIPISEELEAEIFDGRPRRGRLFKSCRAAFLYAVERSGIELPRSQLTHVLRHTFASHFMMSGGNLLDLNKILGHETIQMTMRYAHLSPEHLAEAVRRNPLKLSLKKPEPRVAQSVDTSLTLSRSVNRTHDDQIPSQIV